MSSKKENIVIVGGGIAGLLSAYLLANSKYNVHVIEKNSEVGGLLKSFDYGKYGKFDYGAHNILESGIDELDTILKGLLPEDEWQVSSAINGQKRALSGLYMDSKLNINSPFMDLRNRENIEELRSSFFNHFSKGKELKKTTAYAYSKSLYGKQITDEAVVPAFESLYGVHPKHMDYMAMFLTSFIRVGLFDEIIMKEFLPTKKLSRVLAYPIQTNLGSDILGSIKAYYPKKYGIYRVIESLKDRLESKGVIFHLEDEVASLHVENSNIKKVLLKDDELKNIKHIFWTSALGGLHKVLKLKASKKKFQTPPKTVITNILIDKKLDVEELCYFYNYDKKFKTFRVDNYINYCDGALRDGLYPVSVEMLLPQSELANIKKVTKLAIKELREFGVLTKSTKVIFAKTEVLEYGFPLLTSNNVKIVDEAREQIKKLNISNLTSLGILSSKDLFFESDIKKNLYYKVKEFQDEC